MVHAQDADPSADPPAEVTAPVVEDGAVVAAAADDEVPTIVVTGSRIRKRADFAFSNPVVSIGAEALAASGTVNVTQFLKDLPALTGSLSGSDAAGQAFIGGTGLELLNLRNLGLERTLVLVDGRRHVGGLPGTTAVDIDTIPISLIQDVEILTGGASAIYGADGVSGVVNFIMKRDFEGLEVQTQFGESGRGDARNWLASIVGGHNFSGGKGNITAAFEYSSQDRLGPASRRFATGAGRANFVNNPDDPDDDPNIPDRIPLGDIRYFDSSPAGQVLIIDPLAEPDEQLLAIFNGDDTPFDTGSIPFIEPFFQQGGDGTSLDAYLGDLVADEERYTLNTFLTYQVGDGMRAFGDFKYSRTKALAIGFPSFDFSLYIPPDNAFIPPNIAAVAGDENLILVSRDHFDLGVRNEDIERDTLRSVIGLDGQIWDGARYEMSFVYGQADVDSYAGNSRYNDRFAAALDAVIDPDTQQPTCRSNLDPDAVPDNLPVGTYEPLPGTWAGSFTPGADSGCVPVNIFGDGSVSPEAARWIMTTSLTTSKLTQSVLSGSITGTTFNWFAPGNREMGYAFGVERRFEESEGNPPLEDQLGLTFGNVIQPDKGDYNVAEAFFEVDVPLVEGRRWAERVNVDAALRISDYSTIGNAQTWKLGAAWAPVEQLTFRGTRAKATRAPNISELFSPGGQTFQIIDDPCDSARLDNGSEFRAANCAALLASLGVDDPENYVDPNSDAVAGLLRGNPELEEEEASTTTYGFVFQPEFAPGLTLSLDWYDIEIDNAVNTALPQEAAEICVDSPSIINNGFCNLLTREAGSGAIIDFVQQPVNVANFVTKGYDLNLRYTFDGAAVGSTRDIGKFTLVVVGNKLQDLTFINLPGAPADPDAGEANAPEWQANLDLTWAIKAVTINYGLSWFDETQRFTLQQRRSNPDIADPRYFDYDAKLTQDLYARYDFVNGLSVFAGVNNFTDEKPDLGEVDYPVSPVGRAFFAGLRMATF